MYKAARYYHVWTDRTERDAVCSNEEGGGLLGGRKRQCGQQPRGFPGDLAIYRESELLMRVFC